MIAFDPCRMPELTDHAKVVTDVVEMINQICIRREGELMPFTSGIRMVTLVKKTVERPVNLLVLLRNHQVTSLTLL
jgi:hypothetical protein